VEWNVAAGEGWARLLSDGDLCAAIRAPTTVARELRFAFVRRDCRCSNDISRILSASGADVVWVSDFDESNLAIAAHDLAVFIDGDVPPLHVFDPDRFAAGDLIFVSE